MQIKQLLPSLLLSLTLLSAALSAGAFEADLSTSVKQVAGESSTVKQAKTVEPAQQAATPDSLFKPEGTPGTGPLYASESWLRLAIGVIFAIELVVIVVIAYWLSHAWHHRPERQASGDLRREDKDHSFSSPRNS